MLLLDTHAFVYEALDRSRLSGKVRSRITRAASRGTLTISDISLWEVAMLVSHGRLEVGARTAEFLQVSIEARSVRVLPITPAIAQASVEVALHGDPADRIIAATACVHGALLVTSDRELRSLPTVGTIW